MPGKGYVVGDSSGWLRVKSEGSGIIVALPAYLKIDIGEIKNGREPFTVQEGVHAGKRFDAVPGNLKVGNPGYRGSAQLRFMIGRGELHYPGGVARARTDPNNPIPCAACPIQIPDFVHALGLGYTNLSPYATTWMYLGRGVAVAGRNDRYLHCGNVSAGCITVNPADWSALYSSIILCRTGDGRTLGVATVVR